MSALTVPTVVRLTSRPTTRLHEIDEDVPRTALRTPSPPVSGGSAVSAEPTRIPPNVPLISGSAPTAIPALHPLNPVSCPWHDSQAASTAGLYWESATTEPPSPRDIPSDLRVLSSVYVSGSFTCSASLDPAIVVPFRASNQHTNIHYARASPPDQPVCIGKGLDVPALGVFSTLVLPTAVGLFIWILFAILRPRYRQLYGLREWFVPQGQRPRPLGSSLWAFLFPPVPFIPHLLGEHSHAGKSVAREADDYPSDEELTLRTLWTCILIVIGWSILGLGGLLPLYLVTTPCLADSTLPFEYTGQYSTLQDLSLLRILQLLPNGNVTSSSETLTGLDSAPYIRIRLIVLTILAIVFALFPALWLIMREFNKMAAYREFWVNERCQGVEMGWLSARQAPGIVGWGEKRLKDFVVKTGLSSSVDNTEGSTGQSRRRRRRTPDWSEAEKGRFEVDIQRLFSIGDTTQLALLIDERDEILENLEVAETKYIQSFRLTTPDPSIADYQPPLATISEEPGSPMKPEISRPRPLTSAANQRRKRRGRNPAFGSSSLPPTSYVMPSQYYKLRGVRGISGGQFADVEKDVLPGGDTPSLSESFNQRVVGSRFQEVNASSPTIGQVPMGSQVAVNKSGHLEAVATPSTLPDPVMWGPNTHASWDTTAFDDTSPYTNWVPHGSQDPILEESEEEWHDVLNEDPEAFENAEEYPEDTRRRPRPPRATNGIDAHRETFPLRNRAPKVAEEVTPPHLRLQPRQPFVRPMSGMDHDTLGAIYSDINLWRSKLKAINAEIAEVQSECYNDIADGARIKGWLMIGRGLRFVPGIQLIEGRAKEDIRWDELQNEAGFERSLPYWVLVAIVAIVLAVTLTPVVGLFLSTAPDFAHYFAFLTRLDEGNRLGAGIATCLAAAILAAFLISIAVAMVHYTGVLIRSISLSGIQLLVFKTVFYSLIGVGGVCLFTAGAVLFAIHSLSIDIGDTASIADGIIYMSVFGLLLIVTIAIVFPGLLLLQPIRLWHLLRAEKEAITPRQRFRAVYPSTYNPSYALGFSVLAFAYACAFTLLFPIVAPAALLLLLLTFVAHRFLIYYVYGRTHSSTGGVLHIWLLHRIGTLLTFQPLILGLIYLSKQLWIEGAILCAFAFVVVVFVESYCAWRTKQPGMQSLNPITRDCLETFAKTTRPGKNRDTEEESLSLVSSGRNGTQPRGSFASILDMLSLTLAVVPSPSEARGPVPLTTETLDDLTATERAARTHPDAPPHLPPLPFADHAEEIAGILYAPELLAPPPVIWLPNDTGGIGRSEAYDLERYHSLRVTLDVRAKEDALPRRSWSSPVPRARAVS